MYIIIKFHYIVHYACNSSNTITICKLDSGVVPLRAFATAGRSDFSAFFIAKSRALRPLRAKDGTPGKKKRVCALQKNVEVRATWGS